MTRFALSLLVVGLLAGADKDKDDKDKDQLAPAAGKVFLDGQPVVKATVTFVPVMKGGQKATGTTEKDGTFQLTTGGKKGAQPGEYRVLVTKKAAGKSVLPARYGSPDKTPLRFTVQPKVRNELQIELTSR
jgi:hypothetical protein